MILSQHQFGPEPKLLDNNLSSSRQKSLFQPLGSYAAHTNSINFIFPYNFGKFMLDITTARSNVTKYTNKVNTLTASNLANCPHLAPSFTKGGGSSGRTLRTAASRHSTLGWRTRPGLNVSSGSPQLRSKSSTHSSSRQDLHHRHRRCIWNKNLETGTILPRTPIQGRHGSL